LWVRIPPGAWMFVCCECCVLSGRGLCDGLITRPEESYRLWCVIVCDLEILLMRGPWPGGFLRQKQTNKQTNLHPELPNGYQNKNHTFFLNPNYFLLTKFKHFGTKLKFYPLLLWYSEL